MSWAVWVGVGCLGVARVSKNRVGCGWETIGAGGGRDGWGLKDEVRGGRLVAACITVM
jgi:hypothetical protein